MPIGNQSGRNVRYEVEPADPGLTTPVLVSTALIGAGTAFTALGCLTDIGGQPLTVAGLFLLVAALLGSVYAYSKISSAGAAVATAPTGGKKPLVDKGSAGHVFAVGTWVVFYHETDDKVLAVSPPIFQPTATVTLRQCVNAGSASTTQAILPQDHVGVDPASAAGLA